MIKSSIYIWEEKACSNRLVGAYNERLSIDSFLFRKGIFLDIEDCRKCYCYLRSKLDPMNDDLIRMHLRPLKRASYIFTSEEMFFFNGGIAKKIDTTPDKIEIFKKLLGFTVDDIDKDPKTMSDKELDIIAEAANCWRFSRMSIIDYEVSKAEILKFDCMPNNSGIPIVNQRVRALLEKIAPNDVQFFPAILRCTDGELYDYWLVNVTHTVKSIDHVKSVYKKMATTDAILSFHYLACKSGSLGSYHLAREEESHGLLLISDKLKEAFDREKIKGVWLPKPEDRFNGPLTAADLIAEYKRDHG